jgi:N-acetylmuramoyl-L-alanine amidase
VTLPKPTTRALLLLLATSVAAPAQKPPQATSKSPHKPRRVRPPQPPWNPNVIVLDPAHGGDDAGANLGGAGLEKDLTFAMAQRLKAMLTEKGFTVILTRADPDAAATPDQRAEQANRSRAVACLLLHATASGHGIHLFTSALTESSTAGQPPSDDYIAPWDSAQAPSIPKSLDLANELSTALNNLRAPLVLNRVSVKPIDSLSCPAVALEIAPETVNSSVADETYQQHIAESILIALSYWRDRAKAQIDAENAAFQAAQAAAAGQVPTPATPPAPRPKPRPKPLATPIHTPEESPLAPETPGKPAPIERRPTPANPPKGAVQP